MGNNGYFKKILLVDDDAISKMAMKTLLENVGFYIEEASNGFEALRMLSTRGFDFVLSDINMPKMNGYDLAKAIREEGKPFQAIPIIGITSHIDREEIEKAINAGMNLVLNKPVNINKLKELLHNFDHNKVRC